MSRIKVFSPHVLGSCLSASEPLPPVLLPVHYSSLCLWLQTSAICDMNIYQSAAGFYLLHVPAWLPHAKIGSKILSDSKSSGQPTANKGEGIGKRISRPSPVLQVDLARFPKTWGNAVPICTAGVIGIYIGKTSKPSAGSPSLSGITGISSVFSGSLVSSFESYVGLYLSGQPYHLIPHQPPELGRVRPHIKEDCDRLPQRTHRPRQRQRQRCVCGCM